METYAKYSTIAVLLSFMIFVYMPDRVGSFIAVLYQIEGNKILVLEIGSEMTKCDWSSLLTEQCTNET